MRTGLPQPVTSAAYDTANELLQWNGQLFSYDLNGNMTGDGTNTYAWDARNQLSQFNAVSFQYDAAGRRTKNAVGNGLLYDGSNSVQELSGTTVLSNRIAGGMDEFFNRTESGSGNGYTPLTDALGSTIAMVNSAGSIITSYVYDPFGNTTVSGSSTNQFQYTGRENDGNGLYYYRNRYYSPQLGRFISEDPLGFDGDDLNFYAYVGNDPVDFIDPAGLGKLPANPSGLGPQWTRDPSHLHPNGERWKNPNGDTLDFHKGQPGKPGWRSRDHWHWKGGKDHLKPGDEVPADTECAKETPKPQGNELAITPGNSPVGTHLQLDDGSWWVVDRPGYIVPAGSSQDPTPFFFPVNPKIPEFTPFRIPFFEPVFP